VSITTWLFLYVAGLMELATRYRLSFGKGFTALIVVIPLFALAIPRPQELTLKWARTVQLVGAMLALGCTILFARALSLDFWDVERQDLAWLAAGIGVGGLLAVREEHSRSEWHIANWLIVSVGWLLALWNPIGPWLAIAPAALLAMWQRVTPPNATEVNKATGLSPAWLLFWIGIALPKSWWDSDSWGAMGTALWALGVAITYVPKMRDLRPPFLLLALALVPLLYPWLSIWIWSPVLGVLSGWAIQQTTRPWHWATAFALLAGLIVSYGVHSNLQLFGWLVWGSR